MRPSPCKAARARLTGRWLAVAEALSFPRLRQRPKKTSWVLLSAAPRHATTRAFLCVNRNQEGIPIGVGELVSLHIGAVLERAVHLEAVVILGTKVLHVS